ncbi:MAG: DUF6498-containing protein [Pseudomonadota bacterium]
MKQSFPATPLSKAQLIDFARRPAFLGIIAGNALTIFLAITRGWSANELMWIYWCQSVIIGLMNFVRMWTLKNFSTDGLTSGGKPVEETPAAAKATALFFAFHYGFFHLVYAIFLSTDGKFHLPPSEAFLIFVSVMGFLASHAFSLNQNMAPDMSGTRPNLGTIMFMPYIRIVPMHLTIIFGGFITTLGNGPNVVLLMLFMLLKTAADGAAHVIEHYIYQASRTGQDS